MTKGKRRERQAADLYTEAGFDTYRPQESKWGETDIFGLFDVLAVRPAPDPTHLVQVKANAARGVTDWAEEAMEYATQGVSVRMLVCHDREGWRVLAPTADGYQTLLDERDHGYNMGEGVRQYLSGRPPR